MEELKPKSDLQFITDVAQVRVARIIDGGAQPVYIPNTKHANRFLGFSEIYVDLLLAKEMIDAALTEQNQLLVSALWHAAASIYARSFVEGDGRALKLEERDHLNEIDAELRKLHDFMIDARHTYLAHARRSTLEQASVNVLLSADRERPGIVEIIPTRRRRSVPPS